MTFHLEEGTLLIYTYHMDSIGQNQPPQSDRDFCDVLTDKQDALALEVLSRVSDKWSLWILHDLAELGAPIRFSKLHQKIEGISQKILTQCLRRLEHDGLVLRTLYPEVPPRVEYQLTPLGRDLLKQIMPLWRWVAENVASFEAARARVKKPSRAGHS
jgi:DNA-binding HxlR family transcriptional regulator